MSALAKLDASPLTKTSLAESVYETLAEAILTGTLAGGSELSEVAVAAKLGVSRTPVHEAFRRLMHDGLIKLLPNRVAQVAKFTPEDVAEVYEMRAILEPAAVLRAAKLLSNGELVDLRAEIESLSATIDDADWAERALAFDVRFHDCLAAACGNSRLRAEVGKYRHLVHAFCKMSGSTDNLKHALHEHSIILAALEARDGERAALAMCEHINARLAAILRELPA